LLTEEKTTPNEQTFAAGSAADHDQVKTLMARFVRLKSSRKS
jgi:hypothetical protein